MPSAGTVTVDFAAEVARFNAQLKTVDTRLKTMEGGFKSLERVAKTALSFFSFGIAAQFIKSSAQAAEQLGKMSDQLQSSTTQLKSFEIAAKDAGVATETANKLLADSQRRLGEASQGRGEALQFIKVFGFNIRELQALHPDQLFTKYAEAINSLKDPSQQLAAAQALFGRSAQEAFALIQAGGPALQEAREFVERYALALSKLEIQKIKDANNDLARLGAIAQSAGERIAVGLSPFIQQFAQAVLDATGPTTDLQTRAEQFGAIVSTAFQIAANAAHTLTAAFFGLAAAGAKFLQIFTFGDVSEAFAASVNVNLAKANDALEKIKSIEQIQQSIVDTLEASRQRAEQAVAAATQQREGASQTLPGVPSSEDDIAAFVEAEFKKAQAREEVWAKFDEEFIRRRVEAERRLAQEREKQTEDVEKRILQLREGALDATLGLLQTFGARSKGIAKVAFLFEKARAIAETIIATQAAAAKASRGLRSDSGWLCGRGRGDRLRCSTRRRDCGNGH